MSQGRAKAHTRDRTLASVPELEEELGEDEVERLQLLLGQRVVLVVARPRVVLEKLGQVLGRGGFSCETLAGGGHAVGFRVSVPPREGYLQLGTQGVRDEARFLGGLAGDGSEERRKERRVAVTCPI